MNQQENCKCGSKDDVREVRIRATGRATIYRKESVRLCKSCRKKHRGEFMYVR